MSSHTGPSYSIHHLLLCALLSSGVTDLIQVWMRSASPTIYSQGKVRRLILSFTDSREADLSTSWCPDPDPGLPVPVASLPGTQAFADIGRRLDAGRRMTPNSFKLRCFGGGSVCSADRHSGSQRREGAGDITNLAATDAGRRTVPSSYCSLSQ